MVRDFTQPLNSQHITDDFQCGELVLDNWLHTKALRNEAAGATRTYVFCAPETNVAVGFYSLSTGSIARADALGSLARNMPDPIPMVLIARLAVDVRYQGRKIGGKLLREAVIKASLLAQTVGIRGVMVHALTDEASAFYKSFGFVESHHQPGTLFMRLPDHRN